MEEEFRWCLGRGGMWRCRSRGGKAEGRERGSMSLIFHFGVEIRAEREREREERKE